MLWKLYVGILCLHSYSSKSGNNLFRSMPNGNCLFSSSLSLVGENSLVCMNLEWWQLLLVCWFWVTCKFNMFVQHPALKSVKEKSHSVMGGKLFSSYRTVFELAQQGLWDSKTSDLNCCMRHLSRKSIEDMSRWRICIIFMCSVMIISFIWEGSYICIVIPTYSGGAPSVGVNFSSSPAFPINLL